MNAEKNTILKYLPRKNNRARSWGCVSFFHILFYSSLAYRVIFK